MTGDKRVDPTYYFFIRIRCQVGKIQAREDLGIRLDVIGKKIIFRPEGGRNGTGAGKKVADGMAIQMNFMYRGNDEIQNRLFRAHVFYNVLDVILFYFIFPPFKFKQQEFLSRHN